MISVIIPVYNEEAVIGELVDYLGKNSTGFVTEIIVCDGGSSDNTRVIAERAGAKVVISEEKKRSAQLNRGAKAAQGEVLYFLHADTFPPAGFDTMIRNCIASGNQSGCFRLKFDSSHPVLKFYSWFTRFSPACIRFGDQSLFVTRKLFNDIGGYKEELIVMEDQEIVRRLMKESSFSIIPRDVVTSARKYVTTGVIRLQLIFTIIVTGYYIGVDQKTLVHFYKKSLL